MPCCVIEWTKKEDRHQSTKIACAMLLDSSILDVMKESIIRLILGGEVEPRVTVNEIKNGPYSEISTSECCAAVS